MRKLLIFLTVPMFLGAGLHLASPADPPMAPRAPAPRVDATSRHKTRLHFRTPLTPAAKLVLAAAAATGLYVLLKISSNRSD